MSSTMMVSISRSTANVRPSRLTRLTVRAAASNAATDRPKTCLITGGNTGIGLETAKSMASQGYYTAIACRDQDKAAAAKAKIIEAVPGAKVEVVSLDLADLASVRDFASRALDLGKPLDVLINNAGVMACPRMTTKDGFEYQLGVNHLGHFLLTTMLLPLMTDPSRPTRIVSVASSAHMFGHINFDDLMSENNYQPWVAYGQSKLANVLFAYELARRLPTSSNTTANALHPGVVNTELSRYLFDPATIQWWQRPLLQVGAAFLKTPEQGAATSIYLASSPEVAGITSKYYADCKPITSNKESYDLDVARKLWEVSCELTGAEVILPTASSVSA